MENKELQDKFLKDKPTLDLKVNQNHKKEHEKKKKKKEQTAKHEKKK